MPQQRYDPDRDYYDLLDIPATASLAEVRRAFHQQAKACHPDHNVDRLDWANETFQAINEAYHVLSDPDRRRSYDRLRWPHVTEAAPPLENTNQTASARHVAAMRRAHWNYANLEENGPTLDYPEMRPVILLQTVLALLRGPYGKVYLLAAIMFLTLPLASLIISDLTAPDLPPGCPHPQAQIVEPAENAVVSASFSIDGTAQADNFAGYTVELIYLGADDGAAQVATPITSYERSIPVTGGVLIEAARLTAGPGVYRLRLTVMQHSGPPLPRCERHIVLVE